jgi:hypothetical protein
MLWKYFSKKIVLLKFNADTPVLLKDQVQGRGEEWNFMGKVYKSNKMVRSEGLGLNRECNMSGKIY